MVELKIDRSKPYNQVTWAMAHDSHTATQSYSDSDKVHDYVDQTQMPIDQLNGGIRAVRISTGTPVASLIKYGRNIIVQHTIALGLFKDYLSQVVTFLTQNPNEIVTIIDEGDNDSGWSSQEFFEGVAQVYADCLGGTVDNPGSSSSVLVYTPGPNPNNWPSLNQMIANNTRLVVFMSKAQNDTNYKWILPAYCPAANAHIGMNIYKAYGSNPDAYAQPDSLKQPDRWPLSGNPDLYLFNHYFYDTESPGIDESSRGYNDLTLGFRLVRDTLNAWNSLSIRPNFINVDFYQGVWGTNSLLIPLVNAMNSADNATDAANAMKGILVPGGSYQLTSKGLTLTLNTTAKKADQSTVPASYDVTNFGPLDALSNQDGVLTPQNNPLTLGNICSSYMPQGSYSDSCSGTTLTLTGQAQKEDGTFIDFTLDLTNYSKGYLANMNGVVQIIQAVTP